jgi:hypothetical protein
LKDSSQNLHKDQKLKTGQTVDPVHDLTETPLKMTQNGYFYHKFEKLNRNSE